MIAAITPWFGSKRIGADDIVTELGNHNYFLDPFCGSMAVLLAKQPARSELVSDLHGDLINLAMVLASDSYVTLYDKLQRLLFAEPILDHANNIVEFEFQDVSAGPDLITEYHIDRAYWYFISSWFGRNGVAGTTRARTKMCVRFTPGGGDPATRVLSATSSIFEWHQRLRHTTIVRRDGFKLLDKVQDTDKLAIYVDPPYLKKGAKYLHDFDPAKHARLAKSLSRFKHARVVLSYYDDRRLLALYPGPEEGGRWLKINKYMTKKLSAQSRRDESNTTIAPEILLVNGPSYQV